MNELLDMLKNRWEDTSFAFVIPESKAHLLRDEEVLRYFWRRGYEIAYAVADRGGIRCRVYATQHYGRRREWNVPPPIEDTQFGGGLYGLEAYMPTVAPATSVDAAWTSLPAPATNDAGAEFTRALADAFNRLMERL